MLPFLLIATRAEDAAADGEYAAFLRFAGLAPHQLHRLRLEQRPLGTIDLADWSGILIGGSPFNSSDPPDSKSDVQHRVEAELAGLLDLIIDEDFPFLGACYGVGTLGIHQGGIVDRTYGEPVGAVTITLTDAGRHDPLFAAMPEQFEAFVGHKEAVRRLPDHAVLLASSPACPVQAFKVGQNVYATQFHPELDVPGICTRIEVYKHAGYFPPSDAEALKAAARASNVVHPPRMLPAFVQRYARDRAVSRRRS